MERIFKAEEQQQQHDAIILMMLEEATTRRINHLIDVMDFVCKDIVHGSIIEEALLLLDRKEEERVIAERMREGHRRAQQELYQFVEFNIIHRYIHAWVDG